jgi:hypothetical protein
MSRLEELQRRLAPAKERAESFLKGFEWTWTYAVVFSVGITFFLLISTSVIPSFWLYFADSKLKWNGAVDGKFFGFLGVSGFWLKEIRDAVAMGLVTGPIITLLVGAAIVQNWRRKLRGESGARPTGGYR